MKRNTMNKEVGCIWKMRKLLLIIKIQQEEVTKIIDLTMTMINNNMKKI